jgi:hypothetical protein
MRFLLVMNNYSNGMQKALGMLVNELSVEDYLDLVADMAAKDNIANLSETHQKLISRL